jgi:hypothetical protein
LSENSSGLDHAIFADGHLFQTRCPGEFPLGLEADGDQVMGLGFLFVLEGEYKGRPAICAADCASVHIGGMERQDPSLG